MSILRRQGRMFVIDDSKLTPKARDIPVKNGLYAAVYEEFLGASENPKYKHLSTLELFNTMNKFAEKWLKDRGFA